MLKKFKINMPEGLEGIDTEYLYIGEISEIVKLYNKFKTTQFDEDKGEIKSLYPSQTIFIPTKQYALGITRNGKYEVLMAEASYTLFYLCESFEEIEIR